MNDNPHVNKDNGPEAVPVSCRYPEDRIGLLDVIQKRLRLKSRSDLIRYALDRLVEEHFPGEGSSDSRAKEDR